MVVIKLPNPVSGVYCKIVPYRRTQMFAVCKKLNVLVEGDAKQIALVMCIALIFIIGIL